MDSLDLLLQALLQAGSIEEFVTILLICRASQMLSSGMVPTSPDMMLVNYVL